MQDIYLTIKTRGPLAFTGLGTSLRQSGHETLADILEGRKSEFLDKGGEVNVSPADVVLNTTVEERNLPTAMEE